MQTQALDDQLDDQTDDDARVAVYRERAKDGLNEITAQAKQALSDGGINIDLFFLIQSGGSSIMTVGTMSDPTDELWGRVSGIVSAIVQQIVGVGRVRFRELVCAATDTLAERQPQASSVQVALPSASAPGAES